MSSTFRISEIFGSIQGESTNAGLPCAFVRLSGCNLRCVYCDTKYAYAEGREMSLDEVLKAVASLNIQMVEITGGEPLMQEGTNELAAGLLDGGYRVMVETNGSRPISELDARVMVVMDVKTPGSGVSDSMLFDNFKALKPMDNIKFVITSEGDYLWSRSIIRDFDLHKKCPVLMSAAFGMVEYRALAEWIMRDRLPVRFNLQLHKHIWESDATGV
jgi:7-carboxy-7-deazaguanine synthase